LNGFYHWSGSAYVKDASTATGIVALGNTEAISGDTAKKEFNKKVTENFGINLLDLSKLSNGYLTIGGNVSAGTNYFTSDFIPIVQGRKIVTNMTYGTNTYICLYDANKAFLSSVTSATAQITGTASSVYVRFTLFETFIPVANTMISIDEVPALYVAFNPVGGYINNSLHCYPLGNDFNLESDLLKITDSAGRTSGIFASANGSYETTDYINVLASLNKNLYIKFANSINSGYKLLEFYDEKKTAIKTIYGGGITADIFYKLTLPQGTKFVKYVVYAGTVTHGLFYGGYKKLDSFFFKTFDYTVFNQTGWWQTDSNFYDEKGANMFRTPMRYAKGIIKIEVYSKLYSAYPALTFYDENRKVIPAKTILGSDNRVLNSVVLTADVYYYAVTCMSLPVDAGYTANYIKEYYSNADRIETKIRPQYNHKVLWIGTSIPNGCQYPSVACGNLGFKLHNQAIGSSNVIWNNATPAGLSLSATVAEKETAFRPLVTAGTITEATLNTYKAASFDNVILPFINGVKDTCDVLIFDHGFNDRDKIKIEIDAGGIDMNSKDRSKFIGAFNYILDEIMKINPNIKIIIGGYFQNTVDYGGTNGSYLCQIQQMIASKYSFPIMKIWEKSGISGYFVPNSTNYISAYNTTYGTAWTKQMQDGSGNITNFQMNCLDFVHPYSDRTNKSNERLNEVYYNELKSVLS